jgi:hypothetical protein
MKKQTALQWLIEQVQSDEYTQAFGQTYISIVLVEQAKALEKEQIMDAYKQCENSNISWECDGSQNYYTSTYGQ